MWGLPEIASAHGYEIDFMILLVHILMAVLFVGWGIFFTYVLIRFRKTHHPKADYTGVQTHASSVVEIAVIIIEAILLIGFSIPFWAKHVNAFPNRPDTVELRVVAEQFIWNIHYPGKDEVFGKSSPKLVDAQTNPVGLDLTDPHAKDDIVSVNKMVLPIGRPALIHLSSKDVVHSLALNAMRVKQDAIPGMSIQTWFTPTKTGDFEIGCAQLCGVGHYKMKGFLKILPEEDFDKWLGEQETAGGSSEEGMDDFWN